MQHTGHHTCVTRSPSAGLVFLSMTTDLVEGTLVRQSLLYFITMVGTYYGLTSSIAGAHEGGRGSAWVQQVGVRPGGGCP